MGVCYNYPMKFAKKLVYGVGVNDYEGKTSTRVNGKDRPIDSYSRWKDMLRRCYSDKFIQNNPVYAGTSVSTEWLIFSNFKVYYDKYHIEGFHLDKDIINRGNKVYCGEFCSFVPVEINNLITNSKKIRGNCPVGVYYDATKMKYNARCSVKDKSVNLGRFNTPEEAFAMYKEYKTDLIRKMSTDYYTKGLLQYDTHMALMSWDIGIFD